MSGDDLRALLGGDRVTHVPGVWDPISAALAVRAGHRAVHLSVAAVSTIMLGRPDLDQVAATQIADRAATLAPALGGAALLADADIGYDRPADAVWTALAYSRAGIGGLRLTDAAGTEALIQALVTQVPQVAVIVETRAYDEGGLTAVADRCRLLARAGAAAVLPAGVDDPAELAVIAAALPGVPLVVSRPDAGGGATDAELAAAGVRMVLHPTAALLAALRAASLTYRAIADTGSAATIDRMPWAAVADVIGPPAHSPDVTERLAT
jgi:2-methylisocitrate lyase-like PEP mutase family enzyme